MEIWGLCSFTSTVAFIISAHSYILINYALNVNEELRGPFKHHILLQSGKFLQKINVNGLKVIYSEIPNVAFFGKRPSNHGFSTVAAFQSPKRLHHSHPKAIIDFKGHSSLKADRAVLVSKSKHNFQTLWTFPFLQLNWSSFCTKGQKDYWGIKRLENSCYLWHKGQKDEGSWLHSMNNKQFVCEMQIIQQGFYNGWKVMVEKTKK